METDKMLSLKIQKKARLPALTTLIQHSTKSYNQCNAEREGNKRIPIGKDETKLSLFTDNIMLYIENSRESTKIKTLLEIISQLSKVIKCTINI